MIKRRLLAAEIFGKFKAGRLHHEVVQPDILRLGKCLFQKWVYRPVTSVKMSSNISQ